MDLVSHFFFLLKIKNAFAATALKMVAFAAIRLSKYLREANKSGHSWTYYSVNDFRATDIVSNVFSLPAECKWDSCPFLVVLLINGTLFLCCNTSWTFLLQSTAAARALQFHTVHNPSRTLETQNNLYAQASCITWSWILKMCKMFCRRPYARVSSGIRNQAVGRQVAGKRAL